jgi:hypothetical protein
MRHRRTKRGKRNPWFARLREFAAADRERRGELPDLTETHILAWADSFFARTGSWPNRDSGDIPESPGETWMAVEAALAFGLRGLTGGTTVVRLLAACRGRFNLQDPPPLMVGEILAWADAWHRRTGAWPVHGSGKIPDAGGATWAAVNKALIDGRRGLPGGSSLARLLEQWRGVRNLANLSPLTEEQIAEWADAYHRRTGSWPNHRSGPIDEAPGESWGAVEGALSQGVRGLPGGSTLARLLARHRAKHNPMAPRTLRIKHVLAWADAWHERTGHWPIATDGAIPESDGLTWAGVDDALRQGRHGFPGGSSLARVLEAKRGVCNRGARPPYTEAQILTWADAHRNGTGSWPNTKSGPIAGTRFENWNQVDLALRYGRRGLAGGSSLGRLLAERRGNPENVRPSLDEATILAWADAHHERTGSWPGQESGVIVSAPGETWAAVNTALIVGRRELPGGSTLARLLFTWRGVRIRKHPPRLSVTQVLAWSDAHHARAGKWPTIGSGPIPESPGDTWRSIYAALYHGERGLPGGSSLARLLAQERGVRNLAALPALSIDQILRWARAHRRRTGAWPKRRSGPIPEAPGETWAAVEAALHFGYRGLAGGTTLRRLLLEYVGQAAPR